MQYEVRIVLLIHGLHYFIPINAEMFCIWFEFIYNHHREVFVTMAFQFFAGTFLVGWLVGCFENLRRFSVILAISRLGSR